MRIMWSWLPRRLPPGRIRFLSGGELCQSRSMVCSRWVMESEVMGVFSGDSARAMMALRFMSWPWTLGQ